MNRRDLLKNSALLLGVSRSLSAQETMPVGKTATDQQRNAELLGGYDYKKYPEALTGYTGQDLQRVAFLRWDHAVRTRVGPRGNYKAGMTLLANGKIVLAVCNTTGYYGETDPAKRHFPIFVYESPDLGLTWQEIGKTPLAGKEPALVTLPDGTIVMTAQGGYFGPGAKLDEIPVSRSTDGGCTWETQAIPGSDYPRDLIVEPDGSVLMVRALKPDWEGKGGGSPNLQLARSKDSGKTWQFSEGIIDWDYAGFGEVSAIRLKGGHYLAALRRQHPGTSKEAFEDTVLTESRDGGEHWSKPWKLSANAEVHAYLTELRDGRLLATYSNYHLPWGSFAVMSLDHGKTWDLDHPIQLSLSADIYVGWPVTLQLPDDSLITAYSATTYYKQSPEHVTCEVVCWRLP
jgi:hypothetical protein